VARTSFAVQATSMAELSLKANLALLSYTSHVIKTAIFLAVHKERRTGSTYRLVIEIETGGAAQSAPFRVVGFDGGSHTASTAAFTAYVAANPALFITPPFSCFLPDDSGSYTNDSPVAGFTCTDAVNGASNWQVQGSGGGGGGVLAGDVTGPAATNTVEGIQGVPVDSTAPTAAATLIYNADTTQYEPAVPVQYFASGAAAQAASPFINGTTVVVYPGTPASEAGTYQVTTNGGAAFPADYTKVSDQTDTASEVGIVDVGGYYAAPDTVESALQELGPVLAAGAAPAASPTVVSETGVGQVSAPGTAGSGYSLGNHSHGTPTAGSMLAATGAITAEPMGFESPDAVTISYDKTARTITLTQAGGVVIYWKGIKRTLTSPWVSPVHDDTSGAWFLSTKADADPTWTQVVWDFATEAMVAEVNYVAGGVGRIFALRECHGFMPWQTHLELHEVEGTYRRSGGALTAGTYEIGGVASDARNTPGFDLAVVADEDLPSSLPAWSEGTYSNMYFDNSATAVIDVAATLPFRVTGTYPNYGSPTVAQTEMVNNRFFNVYQILVPVTSDADSQKYRMLTLKPLTVFTRLAAAQADQYGEVVRGDRGDRRGGGGLAGV
jgi:hypothetical protein